MATIKRPAPPDEECDRIYAEIMKRASDAGMVVSAYGGVATIAIPSEQRCAGIRKKVLDAACLLEPTSA